MNFQKHVAQWCVMVFGETIARNIKTRCYRFYEEATELVQSLGMTQDECTTIQKYVFGRPVGVPRQEMGGTMVTLAALAEPAGLEMWEDGWCEAHRCEQPEVIAKIRAKQANKPNPEDVLPALVEERLIPAFYAKPLGKPAIEQHITMEDLEPQGGCRIGMPGCNCVKPGPHCPNWAPAPAPAFHMNRDNTAVVADDFFYIEDMNLCPRGARVILLGAGGVGVIGHYDGDKFWKKWAPMPKDRKK